MSENIKYLLTSGAIPLFVAVVSAIVTAKLTLRHEVKHHIYQKREEVYIQCFDLFQSLADNPYLVFNSGEFIVPLKNIRARLNLYASHEVLAIIEPAYEEIKKVFENYCDDCEGEEYEKRKALQKEIEGRDEIDFTNEIERYIEEHLLGADFIRKIISDLVIAMRKDMGTR